MQANLNMMTLNVVFNANGLRESFAVHIFQMAKNAFDAWKTAVDLIIKILDEKNLKFKRMIKVNFFWKRFDETCILIDRR